MGWATWKDVDVIDRFARFPAALASQVRTVRLGPTGVPALLVHPDWKTPSPLVLWMHGRTVSKELDAGRYLRWIRAGIATCAIDLPGHGERFEAEFHRPAATMDLLERLIPEVDQVVGALSGPEWNGVFDPLRLGIGGMSAGGIATLRRLCDPHPFLCAAVEGAAGDLGALYAPGAGRPGPVRHRPERVASLDPRQHLDRWRPIPLLVLHSEADRVVPYATVESFVVALRHRYAQTGADPAMIALHSWPETGAPGEHAGFGRFANNAKNLQVEFLKRHLGALRSDAR
jgi:alpha-beta hydrolase superfamily lysophospholipase